MLDPRDARPLTSREITKVLASIIGAVITVDMNARARVPDVLELVRTEPSKLMQPQSPASWEVALAATVVGLKGWCKPDDVDTAIQWVNTNLHTILGGLAKRLPS